MTEKKWTPGPWWIAGRYDGSCYMHMGDVRSGPHKMFDIGLDWDDASDNADAHLIAAAPELYEALEHVSYILGNIDGDDYLPVVRARAALAKARGEA